jgi:hypothetical protein
VHNVGYSQSLSKVYIYDKEHIIPVEDANIVLKNGVTLSSDKNGMFEIPLFYSDTVTVSHVSYITSTTIAGIKDADTIFLNSRFYEITPVSVFPKRIKRIGASTQKEKHFGMLYAYGHEIAQKFKLPKSPARLLDIKFHVLEMRGSDSLLIKFDFFNIAKGLPGKKTNHQQILCTVKQEKDISIELTPYNIVMNDDFILTMKIVKVYAATSDKIPYIKIPVKVDLFGETFMRTWRTGWNKKKGASLGIHILTNY